MSRPMKPFVVGRRNDSKGFILTINPTSGLREKVCREWARRSFQNLPKELAQYRFPKSKAVADAGALALVELLKNAEAPVNLRDSPEKITVGNWLKKFTVAEESPRAARLLAKNRPYSVNTLIRYEILYRLHIKDDPFARLLMREVEESDALDFIRQMVMKDMTRKDLQGKYRMGGTATFEKLVKFVRMAFKRYQTDHPRWINAFRDIESPTYSKKRTRDSLDEDEVVNLFAPGVLTDTMERAICGAMFLAGLWRGEIFALRPEDLDWHTPKIIVRRAWQNFDQKVREIGPTKGKKEREAPFNPFLQDAIRKLWAENERYEFVFSFKGGKTPGPSWIKGRFLKWLDRAGITLEGRNIVPHCARHTLASMLEARGTSLRYIQDLLGHSDLKTTMGYLHTPEGMIREIASRIGKAVQGEDTRNVEKPALSEVEVLKEEVRRLQELVKEARLSVPKEEEKIG